MSPRILIVDTYYPEFLNSWEFNPAATYESELQRLLEFSFGTGDFYSRNLRALGWEATEVIMEARFPGSPKWADEQDVVFMQNLSVEPPPFTNWKILAGQISCPWPGDRIVKRFDVLLTSFPHYVPRIEALGVKAVYNPLGFDPIVLDRLYETTRYVLHQEPSPPTYRWSGSKDANIPMGVFTHRGPTRTPERIHDVVFIGGVGAPSHWR